MLIEIFGLVFSIIIGTIGHFLYDWSNRHPLFGFLFAKNESTWEHIKLGVTPIMLWTIIELLTSNLNCLFFAKFISIIVFMLLLLVFYYSYKYIFKKNNMFYDIALFYVCLGISFIVSIVIIKSISSNYLLSIIGFIGFSSIIYLYVKFNKKTPELIIFKEP